MLTKDQIMRVMLNQHSVPHEVGMPRHIDDKWMKTKQVVVWRYVREVQKAAFDGFFQVHAMPPFVVPINRVTCYLFLSNMLP